MKTFKELLEKKLTKAELDKREEIAKAIERENPDMPMDKKMAIATASAKRVVEGMGDSTTDVVGKHKGWRHEIDTEDERDRYVSYHYAVNPEGKRHLLQTKDHEGFKKFVDGKTAVKESLAEEIDAELDEGYSLKTSMSSKEVGNDGASNRHAEYHVVDNKSGRVVGKAHVQSAKGTNPKINLTLKNGNKSSVAAKEGENPQAAINRHAKENKKHFVDSAEIAKTEVDESYDIDEYVVSSKNKGYGYHGQHKNSSEGDTAFVKTHSIVKSVAGKAGLMRDVVHPNKVVRQYLDSVHGRHLVGKEHDEEYIKRDFGNFKKMYKPGMHEEKKVTEAVVSPFNWKEYAKQKDAAHGDKTKTFHDVKKTTSGTVYTKQHTPDGINKERTPSVAAAEPEVKRGRGRPPGKYGSYKARSAETNAKAAAQSAASKAANRAELKEAFDDEFVASLFEGFTEEQEFLDFEDLLQCEEFEQLDELSKKTLASYINKAVVGSNGVGASMRKAGATNDENEKEKAMGQAVKRSIGIGKATARLTRESIESLSEEEFEQLDELSKATLGSYAKKASSQAAGLATSAMRSTAAARTLRDYANEVPSKKLAADANTAADDHVKNSFKATEKQIKRQKGVSSAIDRLTRESIEGLDEKCDDKNEDALIGNQHKLDKNKNGKLDKDDFKLLRKEEQEIDEENQLDEMTQGKEYSHATLMKKVQSGNWESTGDIKPGKHVEMRHTGTGKRVTVMVKHEPMKESVDQEVKLGESMNRYAAFLAKKQ